MKTILIGGLAAVLGVTGIAVFFGSFLEVLAGALPILLILGGGLAFYLGFTEVQEAKKEKAAELDPEVPEPPAADPAEKTVSEPIEPEPVEPAPEKQDAPVQNTADADTPEPEAPAAASPEAPLFKGNEETLVFHSIECNFAQGKKCTAEFTTPEQAVDQGYKPCKICNP